jgi:uncharacterized lipoprotein YajG
MRIKFHLQTLIGVALLTIAGCTLSVQPEALRTASLVAASVSDVYPGSGAAVTETDVRQAAQQYIHPDEVAIVIVGNANQIRPGLEEIAPVTLVDPPMVED